MSSNEDSLKGFVLATSVYVLWGFLPLYMKALAHIPPAEVIVHRIIWSIPIAAVVLIATGRTADLRRALRTPRMLGMGLVTAALISVNWGTYVWAIGSGHALDAALGYYINPLFSVFLGALLLGERLTPLQWAAVALAGAAVAVLTWDAGRLPVAAVSLTLTWGFYAYFKKMLPIGPNQGFLLEILILLPRLSSTWAGWWPPGAATSSPAAAPTPLCSSAAGSSRRCRSSSTPTAPSSCASRPSRSCNTSRRR
ncbi:RarD [Rubellimicrobium mesophilum DSM 19309]|uniref:RarD n=1 Tax=Rubellimicrobium mesophilum DSM 19309 TaxID=442562 RepID=A0A017HLS1_9RHOB|nr:RarD [Rubellimicrobium mesophilum DSM 19309]